MMRWVPFVFLTGVLVAIAAQDDLPQGAGKDVFMKMCVNCHGLEQVTSQKYTKSHWREVVNDMMTRGAEGSDEDAAAVVSYLARNFGKPVNINTASAKEIETGLSFSAAQSEALVKFRSDHGAFKTYDDLLKVPGIDTKVLDEQRNNIQF
jgi:competence ComEA-like helix-hairpin-helix protein